MFVLKAFATEVRNNANPHVMDFDCNGGDLLVVGMCWLTRVPGFPRTYDGVDMTDTGVTIDSGAQPVCLMMYQVNPSAGLNTISIAAGPFNPAGIIIATAWTGVDTADPFDLAVNSSDQNNPHTTSITTSGPGRLIIDVMMSNRNDIPISNNRILINSQDDGSETSNAQYTLIDGSGTIAMTWTDDGVATYAHIVASFNGTDSGPTFGNIAKIGGVAFGDIAKIGDEDIGDVKKVGGVDA